MRHFESSKGEYVISTDKSRLDVASIHRYLSETSYWAQGRSLEEVVRSIRHSLCFGVYTSSGAQVGFARAVTDRATFAWICDVFIVEAHRRRGLGKWLVKMIVESPELKGVMRLLLATRDAHALYGRYGGFEQLPNPERWMQRIATKPRPQVGTRTVSPDAAPPSG